MNARGERSAADKGMWQLRLYVAGETPKTCLVQANLREICRRYLKGRYRLRVIDLARNRVAARMDQIVAIPTLVRRFPKPVRLLLGNLYLPRSLAALELGAEGKV